MFRSKVLISGVLLLFGMSPTKAMDIDIGPITVKNDFDVEVTVTVYHADDIDQPFESYKIKPGKSLKLEHDGKAYNIGGDWLIKVEPAGKDASKRRLLWKVSTYKDGEFTVQAKTVYEK